MPRRPLRSRAAHRPDRHTAVLLVLCVCVLAFTMQGSMIVPAIPVLTRELHTTQEWSTWLLTGFLLSAAVSTPVVGRLGDQHGHGRVLVWALLVFLAGALGGTFAWDIWSMIGFRIVQGLGGAVLPLCFAIVKETFPPKRATVALATVSGLGGGGGAIGMMYSGLIVDNASWRLLFGTGAAVLAVAAVLVRALKLETPIRARSRADVPGAVLLSATLLVLLVAITEGNGWGWGSPPTAGLLAGAGALAVLWARVELRAPEPMVDVRMLVHRPVLVTNVTTFALGYSLFGVWALVPPLVQAPRGMAPADARAITYGLDATVTHSGVVMISCSLALVALAPLGGVLAKRVGGRVPLVLGMVGVAASSVLLARWHGTSLQVVLGMLALGVGIALAFGSIPMLVTQSVRPAELGVATGMNLVMRTVGGVLGGQVGAVLLTSLVAGPGRVPAESSFVWAFVAAAVVAAIGAAWCALVPVRRAAETGPRARRRGRAVCDPPGEREKVAFRPPSRQGEGEGREALRPMSPPAASGLEGESPRGGAPVASPFRRDRG